MSSLVIARSPATECLRIPLLIHCYGNVVDFEPVFTFRFTGLIVLNKGLSSSSKNQAMLDSSFRGVSQDKISSVRIEMESSFRKISESLELLLSSNEAWLNIARQSIDAVLIASPNASKPPVDAVPVAAQLCQASLRFNEHGKDGAEQITHSLLNLQAASLQIHSIENLVQEQMRPAAVVQVLLRIECARLDEAALAPIEALCVEIKRISHLMQMTLSSAVSPTASIHSTVLRMADYVRSLEKRQITAEMRINVQMHAILLESWDMVRTNEDEMEAMDSLMSPLVGVDGRMGCQIGNVSHQNRMIALNAQVQATRYGSKTGLNVPAEALRQVADAVGQSGEALDQSSREIQYDALDLRNILGAMLQQAHLIRSKPARDLQPLVELLTNQEGASNALFCESNQSVSQLQTAREAMQRNLKKAGSSLERLEAVSMDCADFVHKNFREEPQVHVLMREKQLDAESARYTMASEKDVLLRFAGKAIPTLETAKPIRAN